MLLIVSASAATSPFAFTVRLCFKSPFATAVTTFTIPRTCSVRLAAMTFTLSVRSFHVPATPDTCACPPSFPSEPTSRATRVTSAAKELSWSTIVLIVFLSSRISPLTSTVIFFDRSPAATAYRRLDRLGGEQPRKADEGDRRSEERAQHFGAAALGALAARDLRGAVNEALAPFAEAGDAGEQPHQAHVEGHVAVQDVAELVPHDALQLVARELVHRAARGDDHRLVG